jgi:thiol-disulfide isomerase/thioredoxin
MHVFRKIESHQVTPVSYGDVLIPVRWHSTRTYPVVDLNTVTPDSAFLFTPPEGVKLVDSMTDPSFQPHPAPDIQLTDATGKTTPLSSYRGHPVLIDLWATWCGPCIGTMPAFAKLADTYRGSGLTVLTIDEDTEPQTALDYLKRNNFAWKDYHDKDEELLGTFKGTGIPFVLLLDKDGTIVFQNNSGFYEQPLHAALQKMFPSVGISANSGQK